MKLSVGKRILMFLHWLVSLLFVAAFAVYVIAPDFLLQYYNRVEAAVGIRYIKIIGIALLALYAVLAIVQICLIFKRKKRSERGFITMDSSDTGRVRIAISAIEQMVRQSVTHIDGITDMKINIDNQDDAIVIAVKASIVNGSHVPTITMNMQRAIRQFVEMNCGVAVRSVLINIKSVTNSGEEPKRLKLGRDKSRNETAVPAPSQVGDQPIQAFQEPAWKEAPVEDVRQEPFAEEPVAPQPVVMQPEPAAPEYEEEAPAYDFDKPYESEFAKDLAAMKAAEAAEAEEPEEEKQNLEEDTL